MTELHATTRDSASDPAHGTCHPLERRSASGAMARDRTSPGWTATRINRVPEGPARVSGRGRARRASGPSARRRRRSALAPEPWGHDTATGRPHSPACEIGLDREVLAPDALDRRELVAAEQERREVAAGDLGRRPPQGVGRDRRARPRRRATPRAHEAVVAAGQEHARAARAGTARGSTGAPAAAAIVSATASACWVARPPCLIGNAVPSPAA